MADKKKPLALLLALAGPKSRNAEGMETASTTAPDQSGDALSPGGEDAPMEEEVTEEVSESPTSLMLPKGFKAATDKDGVVTTTIRGKINGDRLDVIAIGDMPMNGEATETVEEEMAETPEEQAQEAEEDTEMHPDEAKMAMAAKRKKSDSMKAKQAFQS